MTSDPITEVEQFDPQIPLCEFHTDGEASVVLDDCVKEVAVVEGKA